MTLRFNFKWDIYMSTAICIVFQRQLFDMSCVRKQNLPLKIIFI
jgi:hypothetical protein